MSTSKDEKVVGSTVERFESLSADESDGKNGLQQSETMGTVRFTEEQDIYLVPAPSADPRGIRRYHKLSEVASDRL
jgi:hypothetical protein